MFRHISSFIYWRWLFIVLLFIVSCAKDEDDIATPADVDPRDKYEGKWTCEDNSKLFGKSTYSVEILKSTTDNSKLIIKNFYQLGTGFSAITILSGSNIDIPKQTISGQTISGSGTIISNTRINFSYTAYDGDSTDVITAKYSK